MQYVSWKQGDPTIKSDPQNIPAKKWTLLKFGSNGSVIVPKSGLFSTGLGFWAWYINVSKNVDTKAVKVRFVRDPQGVRDVTGQTFFDLRLDNISSHVWFFKAKKGVPVGVEVYNTGSKAITISTREFKAAIF